MDNRELGTLAWDDDLSWWEGSLRVSSGARFELYVFAREAPGRVITAQARRAVARIRHLEPACRTPWS